jgi:nucleoside-diphosphate-sugar epimerase
MTLTALETARKLGCGKFIALGTVYERFAPQIAGTEKFGGSDFYILSKKYAHDMSKQLALKWGMGFVWATICHPIGKNIKPEQMMAYVIAKLLDGVAPEFGPAATLYDIVAVEDVAFGLRLIGEGVMAQSEYYIGGGSVKPLAAWLEETRKILGVDTPIGIGRRPDDGLRFEREWFDRSVLAAETGYAPKVSFEKAVRNTAGWLRPR